MVRTHRENSRGNNAKTSTPWTSSIIRARKKGKPRKGSLQLVDQDMGRMGVTGLKPKHREYVSGGGQVSQRADEVVTKNKKYSHTPTHT